MSDVLVVISALTELLRLTRALGLADAKVTASWARAAAEGREWGAPDIDELEKDARGALDKLRNDINSKL
jgi:hypothetical protein